ncbi:MAG: hypothetical protein R3B47_15845 [Bacteroidia bacterium]
MIVAGCTPTIETPVPSGAGLNLDRVIVVGSCMSAGMADSEVRQEPGLPATEIPLGELLSGKSTIFIRQYCGLQPGAVEQPRFASLRC